MRPPLPTSALWEKCWKLLLGELFGEECANGDGEGIPVREGEGNGEVEL